MTGIPNLTCKLTSPPSSAPELNAEQQSKVSALLDEVPALIEQLTPTPNPEERAQAKEWADAACVHRYFRATKWDDAQARARLLATLQWRHEYKPHLIPPEEVEPEAVTGKQFITGFDRSGRPQLFLVPRVENTKTYDRQIRFSVFMLEKCVRLMPPGVERLTVLVDFENLGFFNAVPLSVSLKFLNILSSHYPERLGVCVMVNPSWYLGIFYNLLFPFMDPVTKSKLYFCRIERSEEGRKKSLEALANGNGSESIQETSNIGKNTNILEVSHPDQLPIDFGGSFDFAYRHEEFWPKLCQV